MYSQILLKFNLLYCLFQYQPYNLVITLIFCSVALLWKLTCKNGLWASVYLLSGIPASLSVYKRKIALFPTALQTWPSSKSSSAPFCHNDKDLRRRRCLWAGPPPTPFLAVGEEEMVLLAGGGCPAPLPHPSLCLLCTTRTEDSKLF